ncbi:hypothetical protein B0H13DRAFT_2663591 [Mycena leptocephala]|nr:hypothetical protein B0H13DRAFT_2663591 [Mycena leptocephala]
MSLKSDSCARCRRRRLAASPVPPRPLLGPVSPRTWGGVTYRLHRSVRMHRRHHRISCRDPAQPDPASISTGPLVAWAPAPQAPHARYCPTSLPLPQCDLERPIRCAPLWCFLRPFSRAPPASFPCLELSCCHLTAPHALGPSLPATSFRLALSAIPPVLGLVIDHSLPPVLDRAPMRAVHRCLPSRFTTAASWQLFILAVKRDIEAALSSFLGRQMKPIRPASLELEFGWCQLPPRLRMAEISLPPPPPLSRPPGPPNQELRGRGTEQIMPQYCAAVHAPRAKSAQCASRCRSSTATTAKPLDELHRWLDVSAFADALFPLARRCHRSGVHAACALPGPGTSCPPRAGACPWRYPHHAQRPIYSPMCISRIHTWGASRQPVLPPARQEPEAYVATGLHGLLSVSVRRSYVDRGQDAQLQGGVHAVAACTHVAVAPAVVLGLLPLRGPLFWGRIPSDNGITQPARFGPDCPFYAVSRLF